MNYRCFECGRTYSIDERIFRCQCGGPLVVEGTTVFSKKALESRNTTIWRYREAFGLPDNLEAVSLGEGITPLISREINKTVVYFKLDYLEPSGSFKDRGASVLVSLINYLGIKSLVEDSSGNAGAAITAYSAAAGIKCRIFVPDYTPEGKLGQMKLLGAQVVRVPGKRQDANDAVIEASKDSYYASHLWNPYFAMGAESASFEIWEQLDFNVPPVVIIPVGSGGYLEGIFLGFRALLRAGYIDKMPKLIGVQAENCPPIYAGFVGGLSGSANSNSNSFDMDSVEIKNTIAEGIAVSKPPRIRVVLNAIKESKGKIVTVREDEIISSLKYLFSLGLYVEPTSAVTLAGWFKIADEEKKNAVLMLSGIGLKETKKLEELMFP